MSVADSIATESEVTIEANSDHELDISDDDDDDDGDNKEQDKGTTEETKTGDYVKNCDMKEDSEAEVTNDNCVCENASKTEQQVEDKFTTESASMSEVCDIQKDEERTKNVIEVKEESVEENQSPSATTEVEFPDTEISLQHIKGDKWVFGFLQYLVSYSTSIGIHDLLFWAWGLDNTNTCIQCLSWGLSMRLIYRKNSKNSDT